MHECPTCGTEINIVSGDSPFLKVSAHDPNGSIDTEYYCSKRCAARNLSE